MKKVLILLVALMIPVFIFGENYTSLWKKVAQAEEKDLPKSEYEWLQKIVQKAEKGKDYGHLLKAELLGAQVMTEIAPDSLKPEVMRMKERFDQTDDEILKTVYQTVLYMIGNRNYSLRLVPKPELTDELCAKLAKVKEDEYVPFVIKGVDSELFGHDLLSIVGIELDELNVLYDYYVKTGNRKAACIVAAKEYRYYATVEKIDELLKEYQDLTEAGELAISRYNRMYNNTAEEKVKFIREALSKWGS